MSTAKKKPITHSLPQPTKARVITTIFVMRKELCGPTIPTHPSICQQRKMILSDGGHPSKRWGDFSRHFLTMGKIRTAGPSALLYCWVLLWVLLEAEFPISVLKSNELDLRLQGVSDVYGLSASQARLLLGCSRPVPAGLRSRSLGKISNC